MHWLLIGGALVWVGVSFCAVIVHLTINLLRVADEQFQSPPSNEKSHALDASDSVEQRPAPPVAISFPADLRRSAGSPTDWQSPNLTDMTAAGS
jgi:hypothetical protein